MSKKKFDTLLTEILILLKREDKINGYTYVNIHTHLIITVLFRMMTFLPQFLRSRNKIISAKESQCGQLKVILLQTDFLLTECMNHSQRCIQLVVFILLRVSEKQIPIFCLIGRQKYLWKGATLKIMNPHSKNFWIRP